MVMTSTKSSKTRQDGPDLLLPQNASYGLHGGVAYILFGRLPGPEFCLIVATSMRHDEARIPRSQRSLNLILRMLTDMSQARAGFGHHTVGSVAGRQHEYPRTASLITLTQGRISQVVQEFRVPSPALGMFANGACCKNL
jgi:hypothetical protein